MKRKIFISEIMSRNLITLSVHNKLADAKKIFEEKLIKHISIVSEKAIVGIMNYVDFLKVSFTDVTLDEK